MIRSEWCSIPWKLEFAESLGETAIMFDLSGVPGARRAAMAAHDWLHALVCVERDTAAGNEYGPGVTFHGADVFADGDWHAPAELRAVLFAEAARMGKEGEWEPDAIWAE